MTKVKSLLLGSAGAAVVLTAASAAMAADAPMAAAREPVYRCEDTGFWELPGTDTCLKIGGHMKAWYGFKDDQFDAQNAADPLDLIVDPSGFDHSHEDAIFFRARARLNVDARTQTEYGLLRGFAEWESNDNHTGTGGSLDMRHAYVQIGNWLFGKTNSLFDYSGGTNYASGLGVPGDFGTRQVQIRYTQPFGNGFSIAVSLEDPDGPLSGDVAPLNPSLLGAPITSRNDVPDVVLNLSASGDWGSALVAGVYHQASYSDLSLVTPGFSQREDTWAVTGGGTINVPIGSGDTISGAVTYSDGNHYNYPGAGHIVSAAGTLESIEVLSVSGNYTHNWTPTLNSSLGAGWADIDYNVPAVEVATLTENVTTIFFSTYWEPVNNLSVGGTVAWMDRELINGNDNDGFAIVGEITRSF